MINFRIRRVYWPSLLPFAHWFEEEIPISCFDSAILYAKAFPACTTLFCLKWKFSYFKQKKPWPSYKNLAEQHNHPSTLSEPDPHPINQIVPLQILHFVQRSLFPYTSFTILKSSQTQRHPIGSVQLRTLIPMSVCKSRSSIKPILPHWRLTTSFKDKQKLISYHVACWICIWPI